MNTAAPMTAETLLTTARSPWPTLTGTATGTEVQLHYQAHRTIAMTPAEALDLADWLRRAATTTEGTP